MNKGLAVLGGIGLGAGLMYLMDPNSGKRRRTMIRDKAVHLLHESEDGIQLAVRDLNNRAHGVAARAKAAVTKDGAGDEVIVERVRARMGRYVSHPHAIEVKCEDGMVTLAGLVLASEVDGLLRAVLGVRGVKDVINWLEVHETPQNIPSLQGGKPRNGEAPEFMQRRWSPAAKLIAGTVGGAAMAGLGIYARRCSCAGMENEPNDL